MIVDFHGFVAENFKSLILLFIHEAAKGANNIECCFGKIPRKKKKSFQFQLIYVISSEQNDVTVNILGTFSCFKVIIFLLGLINISPFFPLSI